MGIFRFIAQTIDIKQSDVNLPNVAGDSGAVQLILNLVWGIGATLSVMFIVIGGIKYVLSNGDPGQVSSAKNTILYAVIGLVITMSGFAIVNFVAGRL
jgi:hypothetical protein